MSSNAVSNPPANKFQEILGFFKGNGANIEENVDTSKKKTKLTDEAKEALVQQIQENLSEIDIESIKKTNNDGGLLTSEVLTLEDTPSDQIAKMNTVLSDTLKLIERSGGVDKTFLSAKSEEDTETRDKILELATVASMTKNDADNAEASTVKSLAEVVYTEVNPKLIKNPKAGLTQDETQAIKMMLFSNNDGASFAGALQLLQSVKNYSEVAPDTLKEKEVDGVIKLKAKAGSFYKKIERALGDSEAANTVKRILKNTVDTALHGRLNEEQQAVLNTDPSLNAAYNKTHNDLVATIEDTGRSKVIKPLKDEISALFNNTSSPVNTYFGNNVSENKVKALVRKAVQGLVNMVRPSGKGYAENAFGGGSFYETNQKIMNLDKEAGTALAALGTLESSIGTVQQRVEDGGAARLDVPLKVLVRAEGGKDLVSKIINRDWDDSINALKESSEATARVKTLETALLGDSALMEDSPAAKNSEIEAILADGTTYGNLNVADSVANNINSKLSALTNGNSIKLNGLQIEKRIDGTDTNFVVKVEGNNKGLVLNQENAKNFTAAYGKLHDDMNSKMKGNVEFTMQLMDAANEEYAKENGGAKADIYSTDETTREAALTDLNNFVLDDANIGLIVDAFYENNPSIFFGLVADQTNRKEDLEILNTLADMVPDIKTDVAQAKSELSQLSEKIASTIKSQSSTLAHMSLTSGAALREGLMDTDGETFKVSNSLKQNLFATATNALKEKAEATYNKLLSARNTQEADLIKIEKNIQANPTITSLIKPDQLDGSDTAKNLAEALRDALNTMKDGSNRAGAEFAKEFLASGENKDFFKIDGNSQEDRAKYNALLANLALKSVELKEDIGDSRVGAALNDLDAIIQIANVRTSSLDSSSEELKDVRSEVAKTRNVLSSMPDKNEERGLLKVINDKVKDFSTLTSLGGTLKGDVIQEMVKGIVEMAKSSAVKLEPLAEALKNAEAPSDSTEAEFFSKLKTALIAA